MRRSVFVTSAGASREDQSRIMAEQNAYQLFLPCGVLHSTRPGMAALWDVFELFGKDRSGVF
jgi:hypothetical protein